MAAGAEALVEDRRPAARPGLTVVPGPRGPGDRGRRVGRPRRVVARRRLAGVAVLAAVATAGFAAGLVAAPSPWNSGSPGPPALSATGDGAGEPVPVTVVVAPGDTVWDLAREHLPAGVRPRDYVADILAANDVDPTALQPGTVVRLPAP